MTMYFIARYGHGYTESSIMKIYLMRINFVNSSVEIFSMLV